ncbi:uncharacterized protein LOC136087548 [Hydra vulgaris]|uniref:Uncharacterized protein LOC136087548 n=1 Tax=Hydra vulgaris TaxID=6087 RepID=A0ABM4CXM5_HYDVU
MRMVATSKKGIQPERLTPTENASKYHSFRVYLQIQQWLGVNMDETKWVWRRENDVLVPIKTYKDPAPIHIPNIIRCNCGTNTKTPCGKQCQCRRHGINCMTACGQCQGLECTNSPKNNVNIDDCENEYESSEDGDENNFKKMFDF